MTSWPRFEDFVNELQRQDTSQTIRPGKGNALAYVGQQGAEYGALRWKEGDQELKLGGRVEIYCTNLDQSTNAFDRYCNRQRRPNRGHVALSWAEPVTGLGLEDF